MVTDPLVSDERDGDGTFAFNASLFTWKQLAAFQSLNQQRRTSNANFEVFPQTKAAQLY